MRGPAQVSKGEARLPEVPWSVADRELAVPYLEELSLKALYLRGKLQARSVSHAMAPPIGNVKEPVLDGLAEAQLCQVSGVGDPGCVPSSPPYPPGLIDAISQRYGIEPGKGGPLSVYIYLHAERKAAIWS